METKTSPNSISSRSLFEQVNQQEVPDHIRHLLSRELNNNADPTHRELKSFLKANFSLKRFPTQFRLQLWTRLLDLASPVDDSELRQAIRNASNTKLPNQRVIVVDVDRTRADLPEFRLAANQQLQINILTYYCQSRAIKYKQGLNEVLAPFVYLALQNNVTHPEAFVFSLFSVFVDRFLPHLYEDDEMIALQCSFRFLELLLQYHDPELAHLLAHNHLRPQLYASSWLLTLFAQNMPMPQCFELWEQLLVEDPKSGNIIPFLAVSYLCSNRTVFLESDASDLPVLLTSKLSYHQRMVNSQAPKHDLVMLSEVLTKCMTTANELKKHTPDVLMWEMRSGLQRKTHPPTPGMLSDLTLKLCATCSPAFFWMGLQGKLQDSTEIIVVDCRAQAEFSRSRTKARLVFNFGKEVLETPEFLEVRLRELIKEVVEVGSKLQLPESLSRAWRWHVIVVGNDDDDRHQCVQLLLHHNVSCISMVEGNWDELVQACPNPFKLLLPQVPPPMVGSLKVSAVPPVTPTTPERDFAWGGGSHTPTVIVSRTSRGTPLGQGD